jgi:hypothetical protein
MKDWTGTFSASMVAMAAFLVLGGATMFLVPRRLIARDDEDAGPSPAPAPAALGG